MLADNQDMEANATKTTEWLTRSGHPFNPADYAGTARGQKLGVGRIYDADPVKGSAKVDYERTCSRCGGAGGSDKWKFTGWTCFECGGSGKGNGFSTLRLYTADRLAKLNAVQAKRDAARLVKAQAAQEVRNAERRAKWQEFRNTHPALVEALAWHGERAAEGLEGADAFLADMYAKLEEWGSLTDGQVEAAQKSLDRLAARAAARAASQFVGEVGKRMVFTLTVEAVITLPCGCTGTRHYCFGVQRIFLCRDDKGNRVVYKGTSDLGQKGDILRVKATVDSHDEYKGEAQTRIARFKLLGALDPEDGKYYLWDSASGSMKEVAI